MDDVSLGQKEFGEVGAVLSGHAGDEGDLTRRSSHYCTTQADAVRSTPAIACVGLRGTRVAAGGVCALAPCLALHPTRATERRADGNGKNSQTSAPGRKPAASARPKHTEN